MEDLTQEEEEMYPSDGDDTKIAPQDPTHEAATKAAEPTRSSSRRWKASIRPL